ncbi:hypothetical protein [Thalassomonas actiniarum]|uniref:Uncharacterized protein n=1 Tax=Thalassomonas actiniarum TaxID=485447 RepID=A0AAE9YMH5_9GAMM|nr:hypothetical protein [Thalassomonas actiniarum]WDD97984.1 hypothetical protein SG35_022290 [Thalassomonas actiniarum]
MTLLMILAAVFGGIALMVILGERFGKPMEAEQQAKYAKILPILVFVMLIAGLIKALV